MMRHAHRPLDIKQPSVLGGRTKKVFSPYGMATHLQTWELTRYYFEDGATVLGRGITLPLTWSLHGFLVVLLIFEVW